MSDLHAQQATTNERERERGSGIDFRERERERGGAGISNFLPSAYYYYDVTGEYYLREDYTTLH